MVYRAISLPGATSYYDKTIMFMTSKVSGLSVTQRFYSDVNKNASLMFTDLSNEQLRTAYLCRGWERLDDDFNLKADDALF